MTEKVQYWNKIAGLWTEKPPQTLWRLHSDKVNIGLLMRWMSEDRVEHLLKTDLFDEALTDGLYPLLTSRAKNVVGIDLSMTVVSAARSRYAGLRMTAADVRSLPFADGVFDTIVSNSTLDHFRSSDEIVQSLGECHRVLRSGGRLLITLDNLVNPVIALRNALPFRLLTRLGLVPYYVGATFGPRRLRRTLQELGFEVLEVGTVMHCPRVFAVAIASILKRYGTARTQERFLHTLLGFERLSKLPTRFLTAHFVAVRAIKR